MNNLEQRFFGRINSEIKREELLDSEKLLPINFGYGNEHRGHLRLQLL